METGLYVQRGIGLKKFPNEIFENPDIFYLDLSNNQIDEIPHNISELSKLRCIYLSNNSIKEIPEQIRNLKNLEVLDISRNEINSLPDIFESLIKLENIFISSNPITSIPKSFFSLKQIKNLDLSDLNLQILSPKIGLLKNLEYLNVRNNNIVQLPKAICNLINLRSLDISNNKLSLIPSSYGCLNSLEKIDFSNNFISRIPSEFGFIENLESMYSENNKLVSPPLEIISRGVKQVQSYLRTLHFDVKEEELYETKLLFVGEGEVGKTSIIKRIIYNSFAIVDMTHGIDINQWVFKTKEKKDFTVNIWDFGGQEIFHATHKFFLTERSLYIFVWDARKDDESLTFDYWLNIVSLLSNNSPVIIVLNKIDERHKTINEDTICNKFTNVVSFSKVSAKTGEGIQDLITNIRKQILNLEHIGELIPSRYFSVRKTLEQLGKNFISYTDFLLICNDNNLNESEAITLSRYLHDLGVILHFIDNNLLKDTLFLKPEWVTKAVYTLTDSTILQKNNGKFSFNELSKFWANYPPEKYLQLLELMYKFELCFKKHDNDDYYIPELLSAKPLKYDWSYTDNLKFVYEYDFMPPGIITRLIVRISDLIYNEIFWRYGAIVFRENTYGLILSEPIKRKVFITISGQNKKEILSIIRREIDSINISWNNPVVRQLIPCPCNNCNESEKPHYFDYVNIIKAKNKVESIQCQISFENVKIKDVLKEFTIHSKGQEQINYTLNYHNDMKIENLHTGENNQVNIGDKIDNPINYNLVTESNINDVFNKLSNENIQKLKEIYSEYSKVHNKKNKTDFSVFSEFISNNILPIGYSISGSALFEILKNLSSF